MADDLNRAKSAHPASWLQRCRIHGNGVDLCGDYQAKVAGIEKAKAAGLDTSAGERWIDLHLKGAVPIDRRSR